MEKTISHEERIRRAEEIYLRRKMHNENGIRVSSNSVNNNKTKISLFKKMLLQLSICAVIYVIFYLIKNTNYVFSEDVISKTKELLSYDINFGNVYNQVSSFIETNKDKFNFTNVTENVMANAQENENENNENNENVQNQVQENNQNSQVNNTQEGGIGGAEAEEETNEKNDETTKKSQMEIDAEYVKSKLKFVVPVKAKVTSRYGSRQATEIVSAYHYGIDLGANVGTAIYASTEGTVTVVSSEGDYRKTC